MSTPINDDFIKDIHVVNNSAVVSTPAVQLTVHQLAAAYEYLQALSEPKPVINFTNHK